VLLADFMVSLCEDPTKVLAFEKDPKKELLEFGASSNLAELVSSEFNYVHLLRTRAGAPNTTATVVIVVCVV
jgi:hypothetical protein